MKKMLTLGVISSLFLMMGCQANEINSTELIDKDDFKTKEESDDNKYINELTGEEMTDKEKEVVDELVEFFAAEFHKIHNMDDITYSYLDEVKYSLNNDRDLALILSKKDEIINEINKEYENPEQKTGKDATKYRDTAIRVLNNIELYYETADPKYHETIVDDLVDIVNMGFDASKKRGDYLTTDLTAIKRRQESFISYFQEWTVTEPHNIDEIVEEALKPEIEFPTVEGEETRHSFGEIVKYTYAIEYFDGGIIEYFDPEGFVNTYSNMIEGYPYVIVTFGDGSSVLMDMEAHTCYEITSAEDQAILDELRK